MTTFFSNLLVPGIYVLRVLEIDLRTYLRRTLSPPLAGAALLVLTTWLLRQVMPIGYPGNTLLTRSIPLLVHLSIGTMAYAAGYLLIPTGRGDFVELWGKFRRR